MSAQNFIRSLGGLTLGMILLAVISNFFPPLAPYLDIFIISIVFFVIFSGLTFWLANNAAQSQDKFAFTQVTFLFLFGKLMFSVLILVVYKKIATPADNLFVLPFFLVYLCYTALETGFMMKLGRMSNKKID